MRLFCFTKNHYLCRFLCRIVNLALNLNLKTVYSHIYMKKFVFMLLAATMLCSSNLFAQFTGSGTVSDPYLISSDQDLKNLADEVVAGNTFSGKYFMQTADIDLVDSQVFPEGFTPIGGFDGSKPFSGTYDGGGHSIMKMKITGHQNVGMFSLLNNGCIKNLNLENVN